MATEYLQKSIGDAYRVGSETTDDKSLEDFIHRKARILNTKLEVLAFEMQQRFLIRATNLERIDEDKERARELVIKTERQANYLMCQRKESTPFHEQIFKLEQERRLQDMECWRDAVMVMRDFLYAWGAHELAISKAIMFEDNV